MKIDAAPKTEILERNFTSTTTKTLGVSEEVLGHITQVLAGFYTDAHFAVARETISNGMDACIEADIEPVVEVTTSGSLHDSHFVEFKDRGIGMTRQIFTDYFADYGMSTKRMTNRLTGAYGLGAKSFYSISSNAIVVTERDGEKTMGIFTLDEENRSTVDIEDMGATDETGTSVRIPLANYSEVQSIIEAVKTAALGQIAGKVYLNGQQLLSITDEPDITTLPDGMGWILPRGNDSVTEDSVLMGGILYPLPSFNFDEFKTRRWGKTFLVLSFDLDSGLSPTPQRDQLVRSQQNERIIHERIIAVKDSLIDLMQSTLDGYEWAEAAFHLKEVKQMADGFNINADELNWRGQELNETLDFENDDVVLYRKQYRVRGTVINKLEAQEIPHTLFLRDVAPGERTANKVVRYINSQSSLRGKSIFVFLPPDQDAFEKEGLRFRLIPASLMSLSVRKFSQLCRVLHALAPLETLDPDSHSVTTW